MAKTPKKPVIKEVPTEDDIKRGDEILKRMLQSKPKPHKEMVGASKQKAAGVGGRPTAARSGKKEDDRG